MNKDRKYFGTDGIRGRIGQAPMQPEMLVKLAWAIGTTLIKKTRGRIVVGKDTRVSGYLLESAIEAGLAAAGVDTYLLGPMPTPAIAYITRMMHFDAGIVLSASHNPYYDNGLKIFSHEGYKLADEVEAEIEALMAKPLVVVDSARIGKAYRVEDALRKYIDFCKAVLPKHLRLNSLKIVIDCANGAAYYLAPLIFKELGANVIAINHQPDGLNINKECGSTHPVSLQQAVIAQKAQLGIAFDGDADRVILVDAQGEVIDGDDILYIIAKHQKQYHSLQSGVVGTQMTNLGIELALKEQGIDFARSKVGDRYVLEKLREKGWQLGGEASGHIIHLGFSTTGDGILSALLVLWALLESGLSLSDYKKQITKFPQCMINVNMPEPIKPKQQEHLDAIVKDVEQQLNHRGRVLLRASGTEPLMRVMVEGEDQALVMSLAKTLATNVEQILQQG